MLLAAIDCKVRYRVLQCGAAFNIFAAYTHCYKLLQCLKTARLQPASETTTANVLVDDDVIAAVVSVGGGVDLIVTKDDVCERR